MFGPRGRYATSLHGVGLADEYPSVPLGPDFGRAYEGRFEENMTVCVESLIGEDNGTECIKLETQVLIGRNGATRLDTFPWEVQSKQWLTALLWPVDIKIASRW